jgi:hypothetical protein
MTTDMPADKPWFKKKKFIILIAIVVLGIIGQFTGGSEESETSSTTASSSTQTRSYPVSIETRAVINPATISFRYRVTNDGTQPVTPDCTIRFQDPSGTYKGFDIFTPLEPIPAGVSQAFVGQLTITKEGAEFATEYEAECSARTTDVGSSAGKSVKISDIQNFSATDGSEGWYWMAQFKVDQPPMTQMDCVVKALDKSGKVVAETAYRANTLNNGAVVAFGENESTKSVVDASKALVQSINSFDVKCTL